MATHSTFGPEAVTNIARNKAVSETVIEAVAEATDADPLELEPLYNVVDPDALDALFASRTTQPPTTAELRFTMEGCLVIVYGDGEVNAIPHAEDEEPTAAIYPSDD